MKISNSRFKSKAIIWRIGTLLMLLTSSYSSSQQTILWKVTDTLNDRVSTVVGTFHQMGNSFIDSIPEIQERLSNSELAIFESISDIEETRKRINQREKSYEVKKHLKRKHFNHLLKISNSWKVDLYKLKPSEISLKLEQEFQYQVCETAKSTDKFIHFDDYIKYLASQQNIELFALETDSLQLNFIEREYNYPTWKDEKKKINYWIKKMTVKKSNSDNCTFAYKYKAFDLNYDFEKKCSSNVLVFERNNNWMEILPNLMRTKNCFLAVGYFHLYNECGILEQLKNEGFVVEPIEIMPITDI